LALITPKFPRLKEWAYAGFVIDFIGAIWSHLSVPAQDLTEALRILTPLSLLAASYISYRVLQTNLETAIARS
jgi:DoxX-like protein